MVDVNLSRKSNGAGEHDQIIHFTNGSKRLIQGVRYIWENEHIHIMDYLGVEYIINRHNWNMVERVSYKKGGGEPEDNRKQAVGKGRIKKSVKKK
jgi:hypothetical protein